MQHSFVNLLPSPPHWIPEWVKYIKIAPDIRSPMPPPLFCLGGMSNDLALNFYSHQIAMDVGIFSLSDVSVFSKGYIAKHNEFLICNYNGLNAAAYQTIPEEGRLQKIKAGQAVHLINSGYDIYGHWLVDFLPKLYSLSVMGFKTESLVYLIPSDTPKYGLSWLTLLGLNESNFLRYDVNHDDVQVEELLVPTMLRSSNRACIGFKESCDYLLNCIANTHAFNVINDRRLFVSRAKAGRDGRMLENRNEIEQIAVDNGFDIVYPEQMSILEQVRAFRSAAALIGEYGSAMHGSMFSSPGTVVCCLRAASVHPGFLQSGICEALGQPLGYVFGSESSTSKDQHYTIRPVDFKMAINILDKELKLTEQPSRTLSKHL